MTQRRATTNEPIWRSLAKAQGQEAGGGCAVPGGRRRGPQRHVDVQWLVKVKTDSAGNVHYEAWAQPCGERMVLTKPKILTVRIEWLRVEERRNAQTRYLLSASAAMYQRQVDAVK